MTESIDVDDMVNRYENGWLPEAKPTHVQIAALIADWRIQKDALAEIVRKPQGCSANDISRCLNDVKWIARTALNGYPAGGRDPPIKKAAKAAS